MSCPPGYRRNSRYAQRSACPSCGSMLVILQTPARIVSRSGRIADDDQEVSCWESDGYKAQSVGHGFRHVATMRCPKCGRLLSPAQAVRRDFRDDELPADYWIRDEPDTPEARALKFAAISKALRAAQSARRREAITSRADPANTVPKRTSTTPPEQAALPLDTGGKDGAPAPPGPKNN